MINFSTDIENKLVNNKLKKKYIQKEVFYLAAIFMRTLAVYAVLIAVMRFSGKRQIGELQISELVTTFLLSNLASAPLTNASVPILYAIIPIVTLICFEVFFSYLTTKITFVKKLLDGKPSIIVNKGVIDIREMSKMRMSIDDLICELHLAGFSAVSEIDYAVLEPNGRLAFFPKASERPLTRSDMPKELSLNQTSVNGLAHPVIIDGKIVEYAMRDSGKSEKWVLNKLKENRIKEVSSVFLMTVDDSEKVEIIKKGDCKQ